MKTTLAFFAFLLPLLIYGQANIGIGTTSPASSAQLDVFATNKGILVPRVAITNVFVSTPVSNPAEALLIWNTNEVVAGGTGKGFYFWTGSRWEPLLGRSQAWGISGNLDIDTSQDFIGTQGTVGLMFRVANQHAGGIFPDGNNLTLGYNAGPLLRYNSATLQGERNTFIGSQAGFAETNGRSNTFVGARAGNSSYGSFGNTYVGANAGSGATTGLYNVAVGSGAGNVAAGSRNISIGSSAGSFTDGNDNIAIGNDVGSFIQGGNGNVWIGSNAATGNFNLFPKAHSNYNVIIGDSAVFRINGAIANVILGSKAGYSSATGNNNVFIGESAGINNSNGSRNTYLGSKAQGSASNLQNASALGANAVVASSNSLVLGSIFGQNGANSMTNVGIGINNPSRRLWVRYDQNSTGIIPHINALQVLERADSNLYFSFLGEREMGILFAHPNSNEDGGIIYNNFNTPRGLQFRTGGNNPAMAVTSNGNIGIGIVNSLRKLWIRQNEPVIGVSPNSNAVQVVEKSGGNNYIHFLTEANYESGFLFGNPNASSSDASIVYNPNATKAIHFRAGSNSTKMAITADTKVGIGTSAPDFRLHVVTNDAQNFGYRQGIVVENIAEGANNTGEAAISFKNRGPDGTGENQWIIGLNQSRNLSFAYGDNFAGGSLTKMFIDSTGNVGIGTTVPSQRLHVIGNILASGTITPSDIRFKKNITSMLTLLPKVLALQPMIYEWRHDEFPEYGFDEKKNIGVMAQQLEALFPELVVTNNDNYKAVDYSKLSIVLLKALQEQQVMLDQQQDDIDQLKKELKKMQQGLE